MLFQRTVQTKHDDDDDDDDDYYYYYYYYYYYVSLNYTQLFMSPKISRLVKKAIFLCPGFL
jgi:hypothetical protein